MVPHNLAMLVDCDDTAAEHNVAELLLSRFVPDWIHLRDQLRKQHPSFRRYQEEAFSLVRASREEMQQYVAEHARLRPGFERLARFCQQYQVPLAIVSNGLDFYIEALLARNELQHLPVYSVGTRVTESGIRYFYPYATPTCQQWGNCKCVVVEQYLHQGQHVAYIGDGRMDLCPALRADFIFARSILLAQCQEQGAPHWPFQDFHDVLETLQNGALTSRSSRSRVGPAQVLASPTGKVGGTP